MDREEQIKIALDWLEYVQKEWVDKFSSSKLGMPAVQLAHRMEDSVKKDDFEGVWKYINKLKRIHDDESSDYFQEAEILLKCGCGASQVHSFQDGHDMLRLAVLKFSSDGHMQGCALWILGVIQWLLPNKYDDAIINWGRAKDKFDEQISLSREHQQSAWYKEQVQIMGKAIKDAIDSDLLPSPWRYHAGVKTTFSQDYVLRLFTVFSDVPAGGFAHVDSYNVDNISPEIDFLSSVEIDHILIDGENYQIYPIFDGDKIANINGFQNYFVVKVHGHSMNKAGKFGISHGDYVLMKSQSDAIDGDIVLAEIRGEHDYQEGTLKRFHKRGKSIFLEPESSFQERYKSFEFKQSEHGKEFYIRGIAIATFKKT